MIKFTVNGDEYSTKLRVLTPLQILSLAGIDAETNYLVKLEATGQHSYESTPNEEIQMCPGMEFITLFSGATPVS